MGDFVHRPYGSKGDYVRPMEICVDYSPFRVMYYKLDYTTRNGK